MILGLKFARLPIAIFGLLMNLPKGRPAQIGMAVAALVTVLVWVVYPLGTGPLRTGAARADTMMFLVALLATAAFFAAALTQTLGHRPAARVELSGRRFACADRHRPSTCFPTGHLKPLRPEVSHADAFHP